MSHGETETYYSEKVSGEDRAYQASSKLCHPQEGEEVVITGMAGRFPKSDDIYHFRDNLFNKVDLVSGDFSRWKPIHPEVPQRTGKIKDISSFDAGFFGVHHRHTNNMDPLQRMILERTFEAILDSGHHPSELIGTKTGVFIGSCFSESEKALFYVNQNESGHAVVGSTRSMLANHISYFFGLQGPSFITDTACSSSMYAIEHAYKSIREGICDMAIVGGASLCLHPIVSLQFARLGVLSADGICKVFDNNANGYARSETISIIILQKSKDARRIYAHILHSKLNSDGYKEQGITFPSSKMQKVLMKEVYAECGVDVTNMSFVEAHGTGTNVGDPEELSSLVDVFLPNRKRPLYIGAVKSNMGHNEPSAGITSVVKVLIGMESGYIPPNINFSQPRENVEALVKGRLKVVTEKMPWPDNNGIVGINCFGFGGSNGHMVLHWNNKLKINGGLPNDNLPRLVCASGRTKQALKTFWRELSERTLDAEFIKLVHTVFGKRITNHVFRGFQILTKTGEVKRSVNEVSESKPDLVWVFSNFSSTWPSVGKKLISISLFSEFLEKIQIVVGKGININLAELLGTFERENPLNQILGTVTVQICLVELLNALGVEPDLVVGLGTGELVAAYYEGQLSLDEVIFASLFCGFAFCKEKGKRISKDSFVFRELLNNLKNAIPAPLAFFKKWVSLSRKDQGGVKQGSVEYFAHAITSPNAFDNVRNSASDEAVILLLGEKPKSSNAFCLVEESSENPVLNLLDNLGCLYEHGFDMRLDTLYPKISWPVSRGTPMISPLIKWNVNQNWFVDVYKNENEITSGQRVIHVVIKEIEWNFIKGHVIDGRNLFPATGYLTLAWETLAMMTGKLMSDMKIIFENVKFLRAVNLSTNDNVELIVNVVIGEKRFEITEGGTVVVTGKIYEVINTDDIVNLSDANGETSEVVNTLQQADIYKELRIRGYNYRGDFKGLKECNIDATNGLLTWKGNWISFMDNMLQMLILQIDTRNLYVPTSIKQVVIDSPKHIKLASKLGETETIVPVFADQNLDIVKSGAIEFRGMKASTILRRRKGVPVLETYKFIPNETTLSTEQGIRVLMQVILENNALTKVKSVELHGEADLLSPLINQTLGDLPLVQAETIVLTAESLGLPNIKFEDKKLSTQTNVLVVVVSKALGEDEVIDSALSAVRDTNGYIIARENRDFDVTTIKREKLDVLCVCTTEQECLILLRKSIKYKKPTVFDVSANFDWISTVQEAVKEGQRLILYSQNVFTAGVLGLVNCLRREPNGTCVSCFYIVDDAPKFDPDHPFYAKQVEKNLAINVWKYGRWGTYRHLLLEGNPVTQCEHCYANVTVRGDLSSMKYIEGFLHNNYEPDSGSVLVYVYYAALNFRDVMTATGRITVETITKNRALQECVQGFEFTGRDTTGKRVMGMAQSGALATHIVADSLLVWPIPDEWSMEDAATIPVTYSTVIYALLMRVHIKRGQSILIHSAIGGVGQAAINIALHFGCNIFVTVGTQEKRDYLRKRYPEIKEAHIGNSRDTSFEQMILFETKGRGVDLILNSLAEEKLSASVRCVARNGHFLEIGKFDIDSDNNLETALFEKGATFHGIMLDAVFVGRADVRHSLHLCITELMNQGAVKPLPRTVFRKEEVIHAFKLMTMGKHTGKVLVKMRKEEHEKSCSVKLELFEGVPRYYCDPDGTYIILGGLGGFGLQLSDWLIMRRVRKLILTSRAGVKTGYQRMMLRLWRSYGVEVVIRTDDVTTKEGCIGLISYANSLGPVKGVFNLAVVLKDALFENQSVENFQISFAPKAVATQHMDIITREMCPELRQFVVFSSVSCGRGNPGQTNYAMANSVMEGICERRKAEGYPALAIQWGAVGDVGLVADIKGNDSELAIGGTLQQRIASCLQMLDHFLKQNEVIVGSMVVAEKSTSSGANNIIDAVLNILGIPDLKNISYHTSFPELGMDSMMGVEVKQTLEREYEVFLSAQDIRTMTFAKLQDIAKEKLESQGFSKHSIEKEQEQQLPKDIKLLLYHIAEEESSYKPFIEMGDCTQTNGLSKIYVLPGIEGTATAVAPLIKNLKTNVVCLQYCQNVSLNTIEDWAKYLLPYVDTKSKSFVLVAHSFGCVLATELAHLLEMEGRIGKLVYIDGSPQMIGKIVRNQFDVSNSDVFETGVLCAYMSKYLPYHIILKHQKEMIRCPSLEDRIKYGLSISPNLNMSSKYLTDASKQGYARIKAVVDYVPNYPKLKTKARLIRPTQTTLVGADVDYGLSALFQDAVDVATFEGDHLSILNNPEVAQAIRKFIANEYDDLGKSQFLTEITATAVREVK